MSEVSKKKKKQQAKAATSTTTTTSTDAKLTEKNVAQHDKDAGTLDMASLAASLPNLGDEKTSPLTQQLLSLLQQQGTTTDKDQVDPEALMAMFSGLKAKKDANALTAARGPITDAHAQREYKFWDTQPVPKLSEKPSDHGPIEVKTLDQVSKDPYPLPSAYEWDSCDINDPKVMDEVYNLLYENYVEDDDNMFRFDYSREFLHWALKPPGYRRDWHCGVRAKTNKKLFAFITGIPADMKVYDNKVPMVEINFLCVHKKLRSKRLAPVLIKEITRRVNAQNIWQAVYTAGVVLPKPVAQNRYYHRSLNPKKLIDIGFSRLHPRMTIARTIKLYKLPTTPQTPGLRALEPRDYNEAHKLVVTYLSKFQLVPHFSFEEFKHWFTPRDGVVNVYVVENPSSHKLTDLISFYHLPSTVIGNEKYNTLRAAYSFYNVSTATPWMELMNDALILAKNLDFDVFNALNVMENDAFLKDLKFGIGDGHLQYYLYNWKCPQMEPKDVALVLM